MRGPQQPSKGTGDMARCAESGGAAIRNGAASLPRVSQTSPSSLETPEAPD